MVALLAAQLDRETPRNHAPFDKGQTVGGVVKQAVPARLGFKADAVRAVTIDVHRPDRIHLQSNFQGHNRLLDLAP